MTIAELEKAVAERTEEEQAARAEAAQAALRKETAAQEATAAAASAQEAEAKRSLKKRWRIVRDTGLLAAVLRHFPNPVVERYGHLLETEWRDGPYADLDDRPTVTDRA